MKFYISEAPLTLLSEYRQSTGKAIIHRYDPNAPWNLDEDTDVKFFADYWKIINDVGFTQFFQTYFQIKLQKSNHSIIHKLFEKIIPKGSPRYEKLKNLMFKNSLVYKTAKTFYNKFVR